jgi:hypothetical protein
MLSAGYMVAHLPLASMCICLLMVAVVVGGVVGSGGAALPAASV